MRSRQYYVNDIFNSTVRIHEIFSRLPDRFAPRRTQTRADMLVATGFYPWLHTLFVSTIFLSLLLNLSSDSGPLLFDPGHDSPEEGTTQPEYLRVRERSNKEKKEKKKRVEKQGEPSKEKYQKKYKRSVLLHSPVVPFLCPDVCVRSFYEPNRTLGFNNMYNMYVHTAVHQYLKSIFPNMYIYIFSTLVILAI